MIIETIRKSPKADVKNTLLKTIWMIIKQKHSYEYISFESCFYSLEQTMC